MISRSDSRPDARRWLGLAVILSAVLLGVIDLLIVNLALTSIQENIRATDGQTQLTVAAYGLSLAIFLITGGRLGDIYGRKRIFQIGMAGFTVASALCGLAQTGPQLVGLRVVQGAFAALMSPQVLATIQVTFSGHERDKAMGLLGAMGGVGSFLGNVLGGWLVSANLWGLEWRPIFFINVPIGLIAIALSQFYVAESKAASAQKLDVPGALICGFALLLLIFPIVEGRENSWPWWTWAMLAGSALVFWGFVRFERSLARRNAAPLIAPQLFKVNGFARGLVAGLLLFSSLASFSFVLAQYLQRGLHASAQHTGTIFAAISLAFFIASIGAVKIVRLLGPKTLLVGLCIMQIGQLILIAMLLFYQGELDPNWLIPVLIFFGLGQGLSVPQVYRQTLSHVGNADAGAASGVFSTVQQLAFSLGIAVVGGVFFALADRGETAQSFARGAAAAFALNFLFVLAALILMARNIQSNEQTPAPEADKAVVAEA